MREIKFRAWNKENKKMYAQELTYDRDDEEYDLRFEQVENPAWYVEFQTLLGDKGKNWELMQFTGLKDKNGKEIFEGDIVQNVGMPEYQKVGVVEFEGGKFIVIPIKLIKDKKYKGDLYYWDEVIGNKFENPKLLEVKNE